MKNNLCKYLWVLIAAILMVSCGDKQQTSGSDSAKSTAKDTSGNNATEQVEPDPEDSIRDIAMAVSSLADAISVGEELKADDYNFAGILTDGRGKPIYTDVDGAPGQWEIIVLDPTTAIIRNIKEGDIIPELLIKYIIDNSRIDASNKLDIKDYSFNPDTNEMPMERYGFDGGEIDFNKQIGYAEDGKEHSYLVIRVRKK